MLSDGKRVLCSLIMVNETKANAPGLRPLDLAKSHGMLSDGKRVMCNLIMVNETKANAPGLRPIDLAKSHRQTAH